jgi:drug/metabolite transporter (DMT)-like permease
MSETGLTVARPGPGAPPKRWQADLGLVLAAFFFGTTFVVVQDAVDRVEPLPFLTWRFLLAALVLGVVARRRAPTPGEGRHGVMAGAALAAGYVMQTIGLQYTTPSTSAFLTYLLVVFVPIIGLVVLRQPPHPATVAGIGLALAGLVLLTQGGSDQTAGGLGRGELLTLGCAVAFAAHLVILSEVAGRHDTVRLTAIQLTTVGTSCLVASLLTGSPLLEADGGALTAAAFTGVFATALAFLLMVWGQQAVTATHAALIFLLEPVFAAALSWLTGERLTVTGLAGGALILVAVLVAELAPNLLKRTLTQQSRLGEAQERELSELSDPSDDT